MKAFDVPFFWIVVFLCQISFVEWLTSLSHPMDNMVTAQVSWEQDAWLDALREETVVFFSAENERRSLQMDTATTRSEEQETARRVLCKERALSMYSFQTPPLRNFQWFLFSSDTYKWPYETMLFNGHRRFSGFCVKWALGCFQVRDFIILMMIDYDL